jgi:AcrR family transcriptional regulator
MTRTTRQRLVDAAVAVIEADGEQAIKVRDIAARAGVTEPSIYHYFGDRNGLIIEAQAARFAKDQRQAAGDFVALAARARNQTEFLDLVRRVVDDAHQSSVAFRRFARVNVLGSAEARPELMERLAHQQRQANQVLGDALSIAQARGFIRPDLDCEMFAAWIIGMTTGRVLIEIDPDHADSESWNDMAMESVMAVLGHPPASLSRWKKER